MSERFTTQESGWYVISAHGSDGTPGIDEVAFADVRPENTHTQTAFGPFEAQGEAQQFVSRLQKQDREDQDRLKLVDN